MRVFFLVIVNIVSAHNFIFGLKINYARCANERAQFMSRDRFGFPHFHLFHFALRFVSKHRLNSAIWQRVAPSNTLLLFRQYDCNTEKNAHTKYFGSLEPLSHAYFSAWHNVFWIFNTPSFFLITDQPFYFQSCHEEWSRISSVVRSMRGRSHPPRQQANLT